VHIKHAAFRLHRGADTSAGALQTCPGRIRCDASPGLRLASTIFTGRTFGHYEPAHDTVVVSCTLDRADVPEYAIDFVMYHELLHKMLGIDRRNVRKTAHTPEFRQEERRFAHYDEANGWLSRLAASR